MPRLDLSHSRSGARDLFRRARQICRPPEKLPVSEWADRYYVCSTQPGALPGQWRTTPYQRAILDMAMGNDDVRTVTFLKSARVGYSTLLRIFLAYSIAHEPRQPLMYLPTETDAHNTMRIHLEPTIRAIPRLSALCNLSKRGGHNLEDRKHFTNGLLLHVLGGKAARNYREHTKDLVIYDELDGFDRNIEGEGAPTSLGDARITNSPVRKSIRGSTPTVQSVSQIEESAEQADALFRRHLPCPQCHALQPLAWGQLKWHDRDENTVRHVCGECEHGAEHADLADMDARGRWVADDGTWIDEAHGVYRDGDDNPVAAPQHVAFHIWAAYSPFQPWRELVREHYKSLAASKHGDHTQRQSFTNLRLGEVWSQPGTEVGPAWLMTRCESWVQVPQAVHTIVAGVDVQKDRLEVETLGIAQDNETWSLDYRVLPGDTHRQEVWQDLDAHFATEWERDDGSVMQVHAMAIDEGFNTDTVRAFCAARFNRRVYAVKGYAGFGQQLVGKSRRYPVANLAGVRCPVFPIGVDGLKALTYQQLLVSVPGPGFQHFPAAYGLDYFEGITAEKLITHNRKGQPVQQWERIRPRNEPLDCRVYASAAYRIANPRDTLTAKVRAKPPRFAPAPVPEARPPDHVQAAAAATRPARRERRPRRSSFLKDREGRWL